MDYDTIRRWAMTLPPAERLQLGEQLIAGARGRPLAVAAPGMPAPQSPEWVRREQGHAVLAESVLVQTSLPEGPAAVFGIWATTDEVTE